jgi:tRNA dimethylallyltransferase
MLHALCPLPCRLKRVTLHPVSSIPHPAEVGRPRVIVICGPTAVGKTAAGIEVANAFNGEIVGADSMQVYRYLDIGTAKPTEMEQRAVRHHLIDVVDPDEPFDAAAYMTLGRQALTGLFRRGKTPVVVGGTGLYIKALLYGLFRSDARDPAVRARLRAEAELQGAAALHARLAQCDPQTAGRLHSNDTVRILRALEVFEVTGRPISALQREHRFGDAPFRALKIGLALDRETLYRRIDRRVEAMIAGGLEDEVRALLSRGYGPQFKPMQSIGYSHMAAFITGAVSRAECIRTLQRDTRRFAKRQLTWFRADPDIRWMSPDRMTDLIRVANEFLSGA